MDKKQGYVHRLFEKDFDFLFEYCLYQYDYGVSQLIVILDKDLKGATKSKDMKSNITRHLVEENGGAERRAVNTAPLLSHDLLAIPQTHFRERNRSFDS
jgi:hypothetical protein